MTSVLVIAGVELRRFLRDRSNLFFVFVFPMILILLIGAQFGEQAAQSRVLVSGPASDLRTALVQGLDEADLRVDVEEESAALTQVARARADAAIVIDDAAAAAYDEGGSLEISIVPSSQAAALAVVQEVRVVTEQLSAEQGQISALTTRGISGDEAERALDAARGVVSGPTLEVELADELDQLSQEFEGMGQFDFGASGQLILFVFLSSLTGAVTLIQSRRLGLVARTLAAPVTARQLVAGQALGRFAIALTQGIYIVVATQVLFDVDWGSLPLTLLVLSLFSLVAAGAAMLIGATMDNEGAASGLGVGLGLVLAALGGSMMPLEFFPDTMQTVAHLTPHAWAYEAFADIQRRGAGLIDILPQLAVLAAMAAVLLLLGAWAVRRSLARSL